MSQINVTNLTLCYDGSYDNIFENVSFKIDTDWKLGFTGRNGRGKTTFFKLLMGEYPYKGSIVCDTDFEYFPFKVNNPEYFTIDIVREISPLSDDWEIMKELNLLKVSEDVLYQQFFTLSNGEQTKVLIAALFLKENSFLLIDEPTNHLDEEARETLCEYLNRKKGFILISHDRSFLDRCIDHIIAINKTNIEVQKGNFSDWWTNKERRDEYEISQNEKLKKDIKRLSASARQKAEWSDRVEKSKSGTTNSGSKLDRGYIGHKSAKMMKRAVSIKNRQNEMIERKTSLLRNIESKERLTISPLKYHSNILCEITDLSVNYNDRIIFEDLSFNICSGDRIALQGKNGSGKSSILKLICGQKIPYKGTVKLSSGVIISYVSQNTDDLEGSLKDYAEKYGIELPLFLAILRKLDFSREQFEKSISDYSSGQKKKVMLARSLCEKAHLYIWDEPLNFIDIISRMQIEELLRECAPTMIFVEHDKMFCENIATKIMRIGE